MLKYSEDDFFHTWLGTSYFRIDPPPVNGEDWDENWLVRLPIAAVWERIAPVVPDSLTELLRGVYEARWWDPVPKMDVENLLVTQGIIIIGRPYEPSDLPMGCAVRFGFSSIDGRGRVQEKSRFCSLSMPSSKWLRLHLC